MDENKIIPTPEEDVEKDSVTEEEIQENTDIESEEVNEETLADSDENADEESAEEDEFIIEDSDDEDEDEDEEEESEESPKKKKKMKTGIKVLIGILTTIIVFVLGCVILVAVNVPRVDFDDVAITIDGVEISASEFYYAYLSSYSSNGSYGAEAIKSATLDQVSLLYKAYADGKKAGYEMSEDAKSDMAAQFSYIESTAAEQGVTPDELVAQSFYTDDFTYEMYKKVFEITTYASDYLYNKIEEIEKSYDGEAGLKKIEAAYAKDKATYDLSDFSFWYFDASLETSQANAEAVKAAVEGGMTFTDALASVVPDVTAKTVIGKAKSDLTNAALPTELVDWVYKTNEDGSYANGTGAVTVVSDSSLVYVVYVNNAPAKDEIHPVTANYIKVKISTDTTIKDSEDMNRIKAKNEAAAILASFLGTDKSEAKFTEIMQSEAVTKNKLASADTFEGATKDGSIDENLENWLFAEDRKSGDYTAELIETEDAFYIVFYVKQEEKPVWYTTTLSSLLNADVETLQKSILAEAEKVTTRDDEVIADVMDYVAYMVSMSSYSY